MNSSKKVLLVDDEEDILRLLKTVLIKEGIDQVYTAVTAAEAWEQFELHSPGIVVLDIMLPDGEGYDVCRKIRSVSHVPILFLSAKAEELDKLLGLAIGGDDYITKPFSPKEVAYRIKAHLRRADYIQPPNLEENTMITAGPFMLDEAGAQLTKHGHVIPLTPKELGLFTYLIRHVNRIVSKERLYDQVWGEDYYGYDNTVMVHIRRLREKIEADASDPQYLITVKGLGYKLSVKDEA